MTMMHYTTSTNLLYRQSICHSCSACSYTGRNQDSLFLMCGAQPKKYAPQPVFDCHLYDGRPVYTDTLGIIEFAWFGEPVNSIVVDGNHLNTIDEHFREDTKAQPLPGLGLVRRSGQIILGRRGDRGQILLVVLRGTSEFLSNIRAGKIQYSKVLSRP
ncbi:MAG: hypothetical protein ACON3Z_15010 [Bradymonadia bacterium]